VPTAELALAAVHAAMTATALFATASPTLFAFCDGTAHKEEITAMAAMGALSGIRTVCVEAISLVFEHCIPLFDISNDIVS